MLPVCAVVASVWVVMSTAMASAQADVPPGRMGGLTLVDQQLRGAACLDGSAPGYYIREASTDWGANRWVLHAQGGGWCYNEQDCADRAGKDLGSSKFWANTTNCYGRCDGILSPDSALNPDFHDWNAVWLGYCDGTSFSGNLSTVHFGLHYRGRANLDAALDSLLARGLSNASNVVFTGGSAGGLATYFHLDHVAKRVRRWAPSVKVVGLGDAGFFLDHEVYQGHGRHEYTENMTYLYDMAAPVTHAACHDAHKGADAWMCFFAQHIIPHIATPVFIAEGLYDSWQMDNILQLGCGNPTPQETCDPEQMDAFYAYGRAMKATISPLVVWKNRGAFASACLVHCQSVYNTGEDRWASWRIGGLYLREVFANFYFGRNGTTVAIDEVDYLGNPSCPVWTHPGLPVGPHNMSVGLNHPRELRFEHWLPLPTRAFFFCTYVVSSLFAR